MWFPFTWMERGIREKRGKWNVEDTMNPSSFFIPHKHLHIFTRIWWGHYCLASFRIPSLSLSLSRSFVFSIPLSSFPFFKNKHFVQRNKLHPFFSNKNIRFVHFHPLAFLSFSFFFAFLTLSLSSFILFSFLPPLHGTNITKRCTPSTSYLHLGNKRIMY